MLTKEYCKLFRAQNSPDWHPINITGNQTPSTVVGFSNNGGWSQHATMLKNRFAAVVGLSTTYAQPYSGYVFVDVGFDNTAESPSDYCLGDSNFLSPKLTCASVGINTHNDRELFSAYANFTNNSDSNVTVREVGVYGYPGYNPNSSMTSADTVLFFRKVLDTPVVIAPYETYSFTYRLRVKDN